MRLLSVTGMHRSGTSLATRVLGLLGVDLGPEDAMIPPKEANPRGYWEMQAISDLDEELLRHLGGKWHQLPPFREGWHEDAALDPFRDRARDLLQEAFGDADRVGLKDPRLSVLLPFWRTIVPVEHTVVVVRHPDEVVRSLARRDGLPQEQCAGLWVDHVAGAWTHAPGRVRVVYDEILADPRGEAERLARQLGLPAPDERTLREIADFADPSLRRSAQEVDEAGPELAAARALWDLVTSPSVPDRVLEGVLVGVWDQRNSARVAQAELAAERDELATDLAGRRRDLELAERSRQDALRRADQAERAIRRRSNELQHAHRTAERWKEEYDRLRGRRSVRLALGMAEQLRPAVRAVRRARGTEEPRRASADRARAAQRHEPASAEDAAALTERLRETAPGSERTEGPLVSVCVLNRDGADHLRRLLPALARTTYRDHELVVVDNASRDDSVELIRGAGLDIPVTVIENEHNASFSDGNNQAVQAASGELVLLLNNDIEPVSDGWLGHMVDVLEAEDAAAVGARLVYPRRPGLARNEGDHIHPDLTLQHRGVHFDCGEDGVPRGRNLGAGEDPLSELAAAVVERPAVTAACMLVRREAYERVGGLTPGYVYGTEDVDLCLKLRADGGRIIYDGGAVLWHHEYGTQNARGREVKRQNRIRNRETFVDLWGPQLYRQVLLDKLSGDLRWSLDPLHVAITVTKDDPDAGYGDWYTAHELGDALAELGHEVSYVERYGDRWYDLDPTIDVLVVLLDAFDLRRVPRTVLSVAWVRNWTDRWIAQPWFQDYDVVLASSGRTKALVEERTAKVAHLFPLATNAQRFTPDGTAAQACLAVFTGNHWDEPRDIVPALQSLPKGLDVRVHGANWEDVPGAARFAAGSVDYHDLPAVYRAATAVIDDTAAHAAPYQAVNSRVFDALATGTPVITDNVPGMLEVLGPDVADDLLSWQDGATLAERLTWVRDNPEEAAARAARWRAHVVEEHTYARRAQQLCDLIATHVRAERVAIAIGVPHDEERHRWGDEHFARDLQRQFERRGHPCRVLILPEWEEAYAGREDVVLHLFGLSELRTRPSQTNVLWNISHPELVTPALVDRYDLAFSAGAAFAEQLTLQSVTTVGYLPQATDPARFRPDPGDAPHHDLLFVGNSRKVRRRIVDDVVAVLDELPGPPQLAIYGADWTPDLVDPRHVAGDHVDNQHLGSYYAAADVVLNDHWDDMREAGFLSNRLYDALAAGAFVVSDHVEGVEEQFQGAVVTYTDRASLAAVLREYLADPEARRSLATRGRDIVRERHTFGHRVDELLDAVRDHRVRKGVPSIVVAR